MSDTIYMHFEENILVHHPHVYLQDITKLCCSNSKLLNRLRILPVVNLPADQPGRYVISVIDLITEIQKKEPDITVTAMGEPKFILTYQTSTTVNNVWQWIKVIFVCLCTFFGAAFSIMTFNEQSSIPDLFESIYLLFTGNSVSKWKLLEISYSVGVAVGVLFFFNHFGHMKLTSDPTPMQVQMHLYEDDVNATIIGDRRYEKKEN